MKTENNKKVDINSNSIQNLMIAYWKAFFSPLPDKYSLLFNCTKQFAKTFNDKKALMELAYIWENCAGKGFSLPTIELIAYRDLAMGFPMNKPYQFNQPSGFTANILYQFSEKKAFIFLGDLIKSLGDARVKMAEIFARICKENDITENFNLAMIDALNKNDMGMPLLK